MVFAFLDEKMHEKLKYSDFWMSELLRKQRHRYAGKPEIIQKAYKNHTETCKTIQTPSRNHAKTMQKPCRNHAETIRKPCENHAETMQKPNRSYAETSQKPC